MRTKSTRRKAQRSKQTDPKTGDVRQVSQIAIRRRQMRPYNTHIGSMADVKCLSGKQPRNSPY